MLCRWRRGEGRQRRRRDLALDPDGPRRAPSHHEAAVEKYEQRAEPRSEGDEAGRVTVGPRRQQDVAEDHAAGYPSQQRGAEFDQAGRMLQNPRQQDAAIGEHRQ